MEVPIPPDYVGKKVRVEVTLEEADSEQKNGSIEQFRGAITKELAAEMLEFVRNSREEWG